MNAKVLRHETRSNTYYFAYGRTAKTTYEQQQEIRANRIYLIQKLLIITAIIVVCILFSLLSLELLLPMVLVGLLGIVAVLTNNF
jgi:hypothetical protein